MAALATALDLGVRPLITARRIERPDTGLLQTAAATRTSWEHFKHETARTTGRILRNFFFMPIPVVTGKLLSQQQIEKKFFSDFFDSSKPLDPNFPDQAKIRDSFRLFDQKVSAVTPDGKKVQITIRMIETKDTSHKQTYQAAMVLGNVSNYDDNANGPYPFLASFLKQNQEAVGPKTGRFFLISQYSMEIEGPDGKTTPYKAETFDEAGNVLVQLLGAIHDTYGNIDLLEAHSIGCVVLAAGLKDLARNKDLAPSHIHLDRGPSSIENTSRNYWGGAALLALAESSGWSVDVAKEVSEFCDSYADGEKRPSIVISGVVDDYFFPGEANLALNERISQLQTAKRVDVFYFRVPWQVFHERAHHSVHGGYLHKGYLVPPSSNVLKDGQNLADYVVRKSYGVIELSSEWAS